MVGSTVSFADKAANIESMKKAAAALEKTNPSLAQSLQKYADKEDQELKQGKESKIQKQKTMETEETANLKVLRDSAAELKKTDPGLSDTLTGIADKKEKWLMKMKERTKDMEDAEK
jgi:transaldolase